MLNKLIFKVEFSTGKIVQGSHNFEKGLSAITGRNESGKSLRLEMIRYALFGSKALRGASTTYKSVNSWLEFTVNKQNYFIQRNGSKVTLSGPIEDETGGRPNLATGTKPVSDAIRKIFGYDLEVFDIANACLQGEVEAMTNKKPSERKRMVDRTIGLDSIDKLIDKVSSDITATKQAITLLNDKVIEVYELPALPDNYVESTKLQVELDNLQLNYNKKQFIEGKLSALKCDNPLSPDFGNDKVVETLEELYTKLEDLRELKSRVIIPTKVKREKYFSALKEVENIEELKKYIREGYVVKWQNYNNYISQYVEFPGFLQKDLDFLEDCFNIEELQIHTTKVQCPSCSYNFTVLHDVGLFDKQFDVKLFENTKKIVGITKKSELRAKQTLLNKWSDFKDLDIVEEPDIKRLFNIPYKALSIIEELENDLDILLSDKQVQINLESCEHSIKELMIKIELKKKQDKELAEYINQVHKYAEYIEYYDTVRDDLYMFKHIEEQINTVRDYYNSAITYEKSLSEYNIKQEAQANSFKTLSDLSNNLEELLKVKKSLQYLKPKVKSHLLPSLNKVASTLLAQMTNNERTSIVVDEDFEILVDGQPVNTLSGSGKAVANLAVRIGLGSVLTNKIFSVFLADEIDASMDEERAAYTAQCLQNLTSVIDQIILVSHQQPEADHQIEV